jgi:hypothetical protein
LPKAFDNFVAARAFSERNHNLNEPVVLKVKLNVMLPPTIHAVVRFEITI